MAASHSHTVTHGLPYRGLQPQSVLTSEMSDVTLGNSPVIKIILYGPLEALAVSQLISLISPAHFHFRPDRLPATAGLHLQTVISDLPLN